MIFLPPINRKHAEKYRDASAFWKVAQGAQVAVVCPGPSFKKTMADLSRADLIISTLRAAPQIAAAGRRAHIVVAAGFRGYFVPPNLPRAFYIVDLRTHPAVADALPGPVFLAPTNWDEDIQFPEPRISGASSSLAALDVAGWIGAARVKLAGWDILRSRPGTPGKETHVEGIRNFQKRFPNIEFGEIQKTRTTRHAHNVYRAGRSSKSPVPWIGQLAHIAEFPGLWRPFWGPDYSALGFSGDRVKKLIAAQNREKAAAAAVFRRLGYA